MFLKLLSISFLLLLFAGCSSDNSAPIDRYSLVNRHNITVEKFDTLASLSVGNGNFAFTTDFTGLQTFYKEYRNGVALDSLYMGTGNAPDSYTGPSNMRDHTMVLGSLGMLPGWEKIDHEIMRNSLKLIMDRWNWPNTWGWDYSLVAKCATRLYEPELALKALLKDVQKNTYLVNGHNYQDKRLRIYMPGNGGLLKAIALMCAGWEGCEVDNPGFPGDGTWNVKWENLTPDF